MILWCHLVLPYGIGSYKWERQKRERGRGGKTDRIGQMKSITSHKRSLNKYHHHYIVVWWIHYDIKVKLSPKRVSLALNQ